MVLRKLPDPEKIPSGNCVPTYRDHYVFVEKIKGPFRYPGHFTGLGVITMLSGTADADINGSKVNLDSDMFVVVNRGSRLSINAAGKAGTLVLIYFNTILSELVSNSFFQIEKDKGSIIDDHHDFSLIAHVHYKNATLKAYLPVLISLGNSCASFHALKADMLLRDMLNQIISENYSAFQCASNLAVVKESTKVTLYQRLSMAREWLEANYHTPVSTDQLADIAMLNRYHFIRLFKKAFRTTPHQHLTNIRIAKAGTLLQNSDLSVSEICYQVGFNSLPSFSHLFRERSGMSPSEFRQLRS